MGGGGNKWRDIATVKPGFHLVDLHITVRELALAFAQTLHFPTLQDQTGLKLLVDFVVERGTLVPRNGCAGVCLLFFVLFLCHAGIIGPETAKRIPMPTISRTALVEHPAKAMYELVCDIESYPEFLPWCSGAQVEEQSATHQVAGVTINQVLKQTQFSTRNELVAGESIAMELLDGPFKHLHGTWRFQPLGNTACKVLLDIDFEFSSPVVAKMLSPAFNKVCDTIVNAFIKRAGELNVGRT